MVTAAIWTFIASHHKNRKDQQRPSFNIRTVISSQDESIKSQFLRRAFLALLCLCWTENQSIFVESLQFQAEYLRTIYCSSDSIDCGCSQEKEAINWKDSWEGSDRSNQARYWAIPVIWEIISWVSQLGLCDLPNPQRIRLDWHRRRQFYRIVNQTCLG